MKYASWIPILIILGCQPKHDCNKPESTGLNQPDLIKQHVRDSLAQEEETAVRDENYKKYWGYRFKIQGDFDGDSKIESLTEAFISQKNGQELAKFCGFEDDSIPDCYWTGRINQFREPKCKFKCSNPRIPDFSKTDESGGTTGLLFLQNTGDLNGDQSDEIVFIEDLGGCNSAIRTGHLATFKNGSWKILIDFRTRLGAFPELGQEVILTKNDFKKPAVKNFAKALKKMPPFFKKENGLIIYQDYEGAEPITKSLKIN